ncbi:MAG: hypothetical protein Q4D16_10705 [Eubacteriales bacterium]|nr:hypothetical protein [Eubacteriales bacterium]
MKYYFSKTKFIKRAPQCVILDWRLVDLDRWDGMEVLFFKGERAGLLPLFQYTNVEAYYPGIYKNYCDKEEGNPFFQGSPKDFTRPDHWPCRNLKGIQDNSSVFYE